jgi:DNA-binding response OmpR family regulator
MKGNHYRQLILVVDDDPAVRRLVRVLFESEGYAVRDAADGDSGLVGALVDQPDLIILDLELPVMSGRALFQQLKRTGNRPPVVLLSAFDSRKAQRELGAEAAMRKPFDPIELSELVGDVLTSPAA